MGANYNVKLTSGDITPGALYTVYYNSVNTSNIATLLSTNQPAQNLTLSQLLAGIDIDIPLTATSIIIDGDGFCDDQLVINIQPTNSTIPPNLCFTFDGETGLQKIDFIPNGTQNGKTKWLSSDGLYTIYYNNVLTPAEWTIQIDSQNKFTNQSISDVPFGTWQPQGPNASLYSTGSMVQGPCPSQGCNLTANAKIGVPNSITQVATVTVLPNGGTPPFSFSLDGATPQLVSIFQNVGVGQHIIVITDANDCEFSLNFTINAPAPLTAKSLKLTGIESVVSQGQNTSIKRNLFKIEVVPPLAQGEEIQFDLSLDDLSKVYQPGTGDVQKTLILNKNNNPITPLISTTTSTESRRDCGNALPVSVTADTLQYNMLTMGYNDVIEGSVLSTLSITSGGQINGQCATKLTEDVTFTLSQNPTITQGVGTFTISNLTPTGILIQNSIVASSPTPTQECIIIEAIIEDGLGIYIDGSSYVTAKIATTCSVAASTNVRASNNTVIQDNGVLSQYPECQNIAIRRSNWQKVTVLFSPKQSRLYNIDILIYKNGNLIGSRKYKQFGVQDVLQNFDICCPTPFFINVNDVFRVQYKLGTT